MARHDLYSELDPDAISTLAQLREQGQRLFEHALAALGVTPRQCWFVGDGPVNDLIGAQLAGVPWTVLYDRYRVYGHLPAPTRICELREPVPMLAAGAVR
jgi:phosphoglycolate phosphatase-like HAD superfamily hydrolase